MTTAPTAASTSPHKMARIMGLQRGGKVLKNLPLAFKEKIAGYLSFEEASWFTGQKKISFSTWLQRREGIDDTVSWSSRSKLGENWDRKVFPALLKRFESKCTTHLWFKSLRLLQVNETELVKLSNFPFPHLEVLHLNFATRKPHAESPHPGRAIRNFGANAPKLADVSVKAISEAECLLLLESCKNLSSLSIRRIHHFTSPKNPKELVRWNWEKMASVLAKMPKLRAVYLNCKIVEHEVAQVAKIPQLKSILFWESSKVDDKTLEPLVSCTQLERVGLRDLPNATPGTLETLLQVPLLTALHLENCPNISWQESNKVKVVPNLRELVLKTGSYTDQILQFAPFCSSLASVKIADCTHLSDKSLVLLGRCKQLADLEICKGSRAVSDTGLLSLTSCPLRVLKLTVAPSNDPNSTKTQLKAWKNVTIAGVRKIVEECSTLRYFEAPLHQSVLSFPHTDNELLQEAIRKKKERFEIVFFT